MGQYYRCLTTDKEGNDTIYSLQIKGWQGYGEDESGAPTYNGVKLMEHSWLGNSFMMAISQKIYLNPLQIAWVGDYANDYRWESGTEFKPNPEWLWNKAWESNPEEVDIEPADANFTIRGKYLVNHTLEQFLDIDRYIMRSTEDDWCIHPLSLLTACGNGLGGGDYWRKGLDIEEVGAWCWDSISFEDEIPEGYEEVYVTFVERVY